MPFSPSKTDDDGGAMGVFLQAAGHDAHDPGVPAVARGPDQRRVETTCLGLRQGRVTHARLDLATIGVERVEALGNRQRLLLRVGRQQPRAQIRLTDAPARIHARAKDEAQVIARRRPVEPRHVAKRHQPRAIAAAP